MAKRGPPLKFTARVKARILEGLQCGMSLADMLLIVGFNRRSYVRACEQDEKFAQGVKSASALGKEFHLKRVKAAEDRWQASAWFLERKYGSEYGAKMKLDVEGDVNARLVEEIIEAPANAQASHHQRNGAAAQGSAGLPT